MIKTWLIGAGPMACDYFKALEGQDESVEVIGRGENSAKKFEEVTGHEVVTGDFEQIIITKGAPERAIVAVSVDNLASVATALIKAGTKRILLEKPGAIYVEEINELNDLAQSFGTQVFIAYNRRFHAATYEARKMIQEDGGVRSCNFEFTEWAHTITPLSIAPEVKQRWFLANSSHVSDLAFHLCGLPEDWKCFHGGSLDWHNSASQFSGAGVTNKGVFFNYFADWEAPGRWGVEVLTKKRRLIFRPMERLHVTPIATVKVELADIDYSLDETYKPGLYLQIKAFLEKDDKYFCTLAEQTNIFETYCEMAGYE